MKARQTEIRDIQIIEIAKQLNEFKDYDVYVTFQNSMHQDTINFFNSLGYSIKRENTGSSSYYYRISRATPQ